MERFVAFLRGMNLGGRRITNDDLRSHFEAMGCEEVATFRASGNVIFAAEEAEAKLAARVEAELGERLGYEVPVFLRGAAEVAAIAAAEPFPAADVAASKGKLQVQMLAAARRLPRAGRRSPTPATRTGWRSRAASSTGCRAAGSANPPST